MPFKLSLRITLWGLFAIAMVVNVNLYTREFPPTPRVAATAPSSGTSNQPLLGSSAPVAGAPATPASGTSSPSANSNAKPSANSASNSAAVPSSSLAATATGLASQATTAAAAGTVHLRTDVLDLTVSLEGGNLLDASLLAYPVVKGQPNNPVQLLQSQPPVFELQGGLAGSAGETAPTHLAHYTSPVTSLTLAPGQNELSLPLTWSDGHGLTVTKMLTLHRDAYTVDVTYEIHNAGDRPFSFALYDQILRLNEALHRSYFNPGSYAYKGPAYFDGQRFEKINYQKGNTLDMTVRGGYLAALQPYFFAGILPPRDQAFQYSFQHQGDEFLLKAIGPTQSVAAGASATAHDTLYVGPKQQSRLDAIHPALDRVADYGVLTILSKPLFWLLEKVHAGIGNWGVAIIIVTLLLKLVLYPLSETSYRSMAKMKTLAPRINSLKETYKDDREKLAKAQMELYKKEKINPVAGCLPMLIQVPVFFAWYYVLRDSVELHQAPLFLWITDLSVRDPYFVLPILMAVAMFIQTKYFSAPASDAAQQKIMLFMPVAMSATFAFFPSGLVLYYLTNTVLGVLQQWNINRRVEAAQARLKR
ncbi:MAG TPA: membrane protein insertase YidC [Steroidobacteraceae bacterium]|nr:membrane protein insertase YidC [Steroidobacteraceae bacterium]